MLSQIRFTETFIENMARDCHLHLRYVPYTTRVILRLTYRFMTNHLCTEIAYVQTEDGVPNNDTSAKLLHLRNHVDNIYDTFQLCWDVEMNLDQEDFRETGLVNLDAIYYASSNEISTK